jgi:hypothetical protein
MSNCDNEGTETNTEPINPFVGTWENSHGRFVFTETNVVAYALPAPTNSLTDEVLWYSGTYTYDETYVYITTDYRDSEMSDTQPLVFPYSFQDDKLIWANIVAYTKVS